MMYTQQVNINTPSQHHGICMMYASRSMLGKRGNFVVTNLNSLVGKALVNMPAKF